MYGYVQLGMLLEEAADVATATLAGRSGGREKEKQAVPSHLGIEVLGQGLDADP